MQTLFHYKFIDTNISSDIIDGKGKITKYKQISTIASSEESARINAKVSDEYILKGIYLLGKDWNA